jgi:uncharacterized protein (DUF302 family)
MIMSKNVNFPVINYYFSKQVNGNFDEMIEKVTNELQKEGFGIITEINVTETLKKKLNVDFKKYRILGACNPAFAYKALTAEDKIGTMLPCNVIVVEKGEDKVEVSAINPMASMRLIDNPVLTDIAGEVSQKLERVVNSL